MDAVTCMARLDVQATELDQLSRLLAEVERKLEPQERLYTEFIDDFMEGLWNAHVKDEAKFPPESIRDSLARKAMDPTLFNRYHTLIASRERMKRRIATLTREVDAQRSILSALKVEAEASGAGLRAA